MKQVRQYHDLATATFELVELEQLDALKSVNGLEDFFILKIDGKAFHNSLFLSAGFIN